MFKEASSLWPLSQIKAKGQFDVLAGDALIIKTNDASPKQMNQSNLSGTKGFGRVPSDQKRYGHIGVLSPVDLNQNEVITSGV